MYHWINYYISIIICSWFWKLITEYDLYQRMWSFPLCNVSFVLQRDIEKLIQMSPKTSFASKWAITITFRKHFGPHYTLFTHSQLYYNLIDVQLNPIEKWQFYIHSTNFEAFAHFVYGFMCLLSFSLKNIHIFYTCTGGTNQQATKGSWRITGRNSPCRRSRTVAYANWTNMCDNVF